MSEEVLEKFYQESLEERLISNIAKEKGISLEDAMDAYYRSSLAQKIYAGKEGVQYLDYRVLTRLLFDTEPDLFREYKSHKEEHSG